MLIEAIFCLKWIVKKCFCGQCIGLTDPRVGITFIAIRIFLRAEKRRIMSGLVAVTQALRNNKQYRVYLQTGELKRIIKKKLYFTIIIMVYIHRCRCESWRKKLLPHNLYIIWGFLLSFSKYWHMFWALFFYETPGGFRVSHCCTLSVDRESWRGTYAARMKGSYRLLNFFVEASAENDITTQSSKT